MRNITLVFLFSLAVLIPALVNADDTNTAQFLWPPINVFYPNFQIPVISKNPTSDQYKLNVSWDLSGVSASSVTLQYGRDSKSTVWTNITTLSGTTTQYLFTPSLLDAAKDYRLRLINADVVASNATNTLTPILSGNFVVYQPIDLSLDMSLPAPNSATRWSANFLLVVVAYILQEYYESIKKKNADSKLLYTVKKALRNLSEFPERLQDGQDAQRRVKGVGPSLAKLLDSKSSNTLNVASESNAPPVKKRKHNSEYLVPFRSSAYAILLSLYEFYQKTPQQIMLGRSDVLEHVGKYCDSANVWSGARILISKGMVDVSGICPKLYFLTPEGLIMAEKVASISPDYVQVSNLEAPSEDVPSKIPNEEMESESLLPAATLNSQDPTDKTWLPKDVQSLRSNAYDIVLLLDSRETFRGDREYFQRNLQRHGIKVETMALPIADMLWIARPKDMLQQSCQSLIVLDYAVERKRIDDLVASVRDSRWKEQKWRLAQSGIPQLFYIVEESPAHMHSIESLGAQAIQTIKSQTILWGGFHLQVTKSVDETIQWIIATTRTIIDLWKDKDVFYLNVQHVLNRDQWLLYKRYGTVKDHVLERNDERGNGTLDHCTQSIHIPLSLFTEFVSKSQQATLQDIFVQMLMRIRQVSKEKAKFIAQAHPTPKLLMNALSRIPPCERPDYFEQLSRERERSDGYLGRKKINSSISQNICKLLTSTHYECTYLHIRNWRILQIQPNMEDATEKKNDNAAQNRASTQITLQSSTVDEPDNDLPSSNNELAHQPPAGESNGPSSPTKNTVADPVHQNDLQTPGAFPSENVTQNGPNRRQAPSLVAAANSVLGQIDPATRQHMQDVGWQILEKFSRVTRASKDAATRILDHPLTRPILPILPKDISTLSTSYNPEMQQGTALEAMVSEFPGAGMYLAQWVQRRMRGEQAHAGYELSAVDVWSDSDEEGECGDFEVLSTAATLPKPKARRDPKHMLTAELWIQYVTSNFSQSIPLEGLSPVSTEPSISDVIEEIKLRIFYGGVDVDVRPEVWKFLLGYLPWGSTQSEQLVIVQSKRDQYKDLLGKWQANSKQTVDIDQWEERRHLIIKDVVRTDRHHRFFGGDVDRDKQACLTNQEEEDMLLSNQQDTPVHKNLIKLRNVLMTYVQYLNDVGRHELGYVQGMSDICSHFLMLQDGDESDTFWCFVGFMERLHPNFNMDQKAMHHQLSTLRGLVQFIDNPLFKHLSRCDALNMFFAFRWLLIWFKREFSIPDVLRIWEVCLSDVYSPEYQLFIALAILDLNRQEIMSKLHQFDEVLKFVNELAENIDVDLVLARAEEMYRMFETKLRMIRGNAISNEAPSRTGRVGTVDRELSKSLRPLTLADL